MSTLNTRKIRNLFLSTIIFLLWTLLICFLWRQPIILTFILIIICIIYFIFFRVKNDLIYFLIAAIFGPIGEAIVSASGLWKYNGQTIFGIPYWLPLAWGITAVMIKRLIFSLGR